jgi:HK97 gp10 family phage protein
MSGVTVELRQDTTVLDRLLRTLPQATVQATLDAANDVVADIKQSLDVPYPPASSPGEPPHKRSGDLQKSYGAVLVEQLSSGKVSVAIISTDPVSIFTEFGTKKMAARPHIRPAMKRADKYFRRRFTIVVKAR